MARTKRDKGGRPRRTDDPQRLVTHLASALKKRLLHQAIEEGRPAGSIISDALKMYLDAKEGRKS